MLKWRVIAIVASLVPLLIIALLLNVGPKDIASVGVIPFIVASGIAVVRLLIQGVRYHYYVKSFVGPVADLRRNLEVRTGSEFVSLTTPAYIGGEFVRLSWLHKRGVHAGKGMWIITMEVITDVLIGTSLAYVAAVLAFMAQNYFIATAIVVVTTPIFATYMGLLILSAKRKIQMPRFLLPVLSRIIGSEKAARWVNTANDTVKVLCQTSKENLRSSSHSIFTVGLGLTFVVALLQALTFFVLAGTTANVGFFESLMAVASSVAIGTVPVSPGGSGLSEFGLGYYLNTFQFDPALFGSVIIAWRIASYHVPLVLSWLVLMKMSSVKIRKSIQRPQ